MSLVAKESRKEFYLKEDNKRYLDYIKILLDDKSYSISEQTEEDKKFKRKLFQIGEKTFNISYSQDYKTIESIYEVSTEGCITVKYEGERIIFKNAAETVKFLRDNVSRYPSFEVITNKEIFYLNSIEEILLFIRLFNKNLNISQPY